MHLIKRNSNENFYWQKENFCQIPSLPYATYIEYYFGLECLVYQSFDYTIHLKITTRKTIVFEMKFSLLVIFIFTLLLHKTFVVGDVKPSCLMIPFRSQQKLRCILINATLLNTLVSMSIPLTWEAVPWLEVYVF